MRPVEAISIDTITTYSEVESAGEIWPWPIYSRAADLVTIAQSPYFMYRIYRL
jgi:hypothetical protein